MTIQLYFCAPENYDGRKPPGKGDGPFYTDEAEARAEFAECEALELQRERPEKLAVYCAEVRHMEVTGRWTAGLYDEDCNEEGPAGPVDAEDRGWRSMR